MIKCCKCQRLLKGEHFAKVGKLTRSGGKLECLSCKKQCECCGHRLEKDRFKIHNSTICDVCLEKRAAAKGNVYFRYPTLKYNSSPFATDKFRQIIADDDRPDV